MQNNEKLSHSLSLLGEWGVGKTLVGVEVRIRAVYVPFLRSVCTRSGKIPKIVVTIRLHSDARTKM